jgi:hypothetical protein
MPLREFSRREALRIGLGGLGGLSLAELYRLRAASTEHGSARQKSVIMIFLLGGPSHMDMYDLKPNAPVEYRGEFSPIRTNVPGMDICEHMPRQARIADKLAVVQGISFSGAHNVYEMLTGFKPLSSPQIGPSPRPSVGSVVSKLREHSSGAIPPYVSFRKLNLTTADDEFETPAYLGPRYGPLRLTGAAMDNLTLVQGVSANRLEDRRRLLRTFDGLHRQMNGIVDAMVDMDRCTTQALNVITSSAVREAFDVTREPARVRESYGGYDDFLRARRLVEAGVSIVTLPASFLVQIPDIIDPGWDTHGSNFAILRRKLPRYDLALTALINDLDQRGLLDDVAVLVYGDFGRRPRIGDVTPDGRGHWPSAGFALLAGGGLRTGQVIGATDARAERARGRPFTPANVLATLYRLLGIDLATTFPDHSGRPRVLLDGEQPIEELL